MSLAGSRGDPVQCREDCAHDLVSQSMASVPDSHVSRRAVQDNIDDNSMSSSDESLPDTIDGIMAYGQRNHHRRTAADQRGSAVIAEVTPQHQLRRRTRSHESEQSRPSARRRLEHVNAGMDVIETEASDIGQHRGPACTGASTEVYPPISRDSVPFIPAEAEDIGEWQNIVHANLPINIDESTEVFIQASTTSLAARALQFLLLWHFASPPAPYHQFEAALERALPGVVCSFVPLAALLSSKRVFEVNVGVGAAPEKAVLRDAIAQMTSEVRFWVEKGVYKSLVFHSSTDHFRTRDCILKAYGFLCLMHLVNLGQGPEPVSPFLLQAVIDGRSNILIDREFILSLDPGQFAVLQPWYDWNGTSPLTTDPKTDLGALLIEADIVIEALSLEGMDEAERNGVERTLVSRVLLGHIDPTHHPDLLAFREGLNFQLRPGQDIRKTMEGRTKALLGALNDKEDQQTEVERQHELRFAELLIRYLHGKGHPDHEWIRGEVVPEDMYMKEHENVVHRVRLLLQVMTGSDLLPLGEHWKLKFSFTHASSYQDGGAHLNNAEEITPILYSACFMQGKVTMDVGLQNLLLQEVDGPDHALYFDAWMHGPLMAGDGFNKI
ncbi:hypothetical protein SCP_0408870 [Sparassis crispa]|uniref:Uncharacterized protein n=1 Tax=Sparassis crispa TaxID=139825 RepID=A0A401GK18_9APHY|nr:hypothetical protein SCP_0408870 [Sparassis crispa]GBE82503.1 hypothetical protein SCP_0408870 [Sparassis crispa]